MRVVLLSPVGEKKQRGMKRLFDIIAKNKVVFGKKNPGDIVTEMDYACPCPRQSALRILIRSVLTAPAAVAV